MCETTAERTGLPMPGARKLTPVRSSSTSMLRDTTPCKTPSMLLLASCVEHRSTSPEVPSAPGHDQCACGAAIRCERGGDSGGDLLDSAQNEI